MCFSWIRVPSGPCTDTGAGRFRRVPLCFCLLPLRPVGARRPSALSAGYCPSVQGRIPNARFRGWGLRLHPARWDLPSLPPGLIAVKRAALQQVPCRHVSCRVTLGVAPVKNLPSLHKYASAHHSHGAGPGLPPLSPTHSAHDPGQPAMSIYTDRPRASRSDCLELLAWPTRIETEVPLIWYISYVWAVIRNNTTGSPPAGSVWKTPEPVGTGPGTG